MASYNAEWHIQYGFPYPRFVEESFKSVKDAAEAVKRYGIPPWNAQLVSDSFGIGGCHRATWNDRLRKWVNPRTGTAWWGHGDPNNEAEIDG